MSRSLGLREDQQVGATLMMRINALFPAPSAINVASGACCGEGACPPLGRAAAPVQPTHIFRQTVLAGFGAASQPNGGQAPSPQEAVCNH